MNAPSIKKILTVIFCTAFIPSILEGDYLGTKLFDYTVQNNDLPYGEYMMVRSYRKVTQLLISTGVSRLYLYTDRDNEEYSELYATGFSRVDSLIIDPPEMEQVKFDRIIQWLLVYGDSREISTMKFPGLDSVMKMIRSGQASVVYDENESLVRIRKTPAMNPHILKFSMPWNKLTMRYETGGSDALPLIYQVYIDESRDRNIKPVIRRFISAARKRSAMQHDPGLITP